jgi:hypothetical protein
LLKLLDLANAGVARLVALQKVAISG